MPQSLLRSPPFPLGFGLVWLIIVFVSVSYRQMEEQKKPLNSASEVPEEMKSCRKKKTDDNTSFLTDLKDHIDEFVNASVDEHKTCFTKTIQKVSFLFLVWRTTTTTMYLIPSSFPSRCLECPKLSRKETATLLLLLLEAMLKVIFLFKHL